MKIPVSYLEAKERLSGEYFEAFEHIESYCQTEFTTESDLEDRMGYLLDIFLSAQNDGIPVDSIIGASVKTFCKDFMSDCDAKSVFAYIADILRRASWVAVVLGVIAVVIKLISGGSIISVFTQSTKIADCVIIGAVMAIVTQIISSVIIRGFIFRIKKYRGVYHKIVVSIVSFVMLASIYIISYNDFTLGIPTALVLSVAVMYLAGYYLFRGISNIKQGKAFFFNGDKRQKTGFSQKVLIAMVGEFRNMYSKENEKRAKKGQPALTHNEFTEKMDKDTKTARISVIVCAVLLAALYIYNLISLAIESTAADTLAYAVMLLAVLALVYLLLIHFSVVYPYLARKRFFEILKKSGKTVFDDDVYDCINDYADGDLD